MAPPGLVAIITDFGTRDSYVAEMKAAMLRIDAGIRFVDISHDVPPGDVRAAAYLLSRSSTHFPEDTVFLAVVDPGVGSNRKIVAVETETGQRFVGPDNGLFWNLCSDTRYSAYDISAYIDFGQSATISTTFEGRDRMAPVAARIASGSSTAEFGERITEIISLEPIPVLRTAAGMEGEIIWVDRYGNAVTNLPKDDIRTLGESVDIFVQGRFSAKDISTTFSSVAQGEPLAYIGSCDLLEIAINSGDFASRYEVKRGARVEVRRREEPR